MTRKIMRHLMENNSYFKWGKKRLAKKYGCSQKDITTILNKLETIKETYLKNLRG